MNCTQKLGVGGSSMCTLAHLYSALRACLSPCFVQEAWISLQDPAAFVGQMEEALWYIGGTYPFVGVG